METIVNYALHAPTHLTKEIRNQNGKILQTENYVFEEVSQTEILKARLQNKKAIILTFRKKYYLALLPDDISLPQNFIRVEHLCSFCDRCSAALDENGGCPKVRDYTLFANIHFHSILTSNTSMENTLPQKSLQEWKEKRKKAYLQAVKESKRLEKYPFITYGLETIHMKPNLFLVLKCNKFKEYPPPKYENRTEAMAVIRKFTDSAEAYLHSYK